MKLTDYLLYLLPISGLSWLIFKAHLFICKIRGRNPFNIDEKVTKNATKLYWEDLYAPKDT